MLILSTVEYIYFINKIYSKKITTGWTWDYIPTTR